MNLTRTITHRNGGIEQALLEIADQDGLLSAADKERLKNLKAMPQNRTEVIDTREVRLKK